MSEYVMPNRKFADEITTDGKVVSIVLRRHTKTQKTVPTEGKAKNYVQTWVLDPGKRDMFVAVNQKGKKVKCSSKQF